MARIHFTQQLARFLPVPQVDTDAGSLREGLEQAFSGNPALRGYILDDQGSLRANVTIFVDGKHPRDPRLLDDPLHPASKVYVLQALSGG